MNKILSKPVSFKLAKLAKEKSFDEPVYKYYDIYYEKPEDIYCLGSFENWNKQPNLISAPTIAEMLDYIFDKYNIWIEVRKSTKNSLSCFSPYIDNRPVKEDIFFNDYDLPLEAYETAIEYVLLNFEK